MDIIVTISLAVLATFLLKKLTQRNLRLPPGPKGIPFLGNLLDMPTGASWATFSPMSKQYGEYSLFLHPFPSLMF